MLTIAFCSTISPDALYESWPKTLVCLKVFIFVRIQVYLFTHLTGDTSFSRLHFT